MASPSRAPIPLWLPFAVVTLLIVLPFAGPVADRVRAAERADDGQALLVVADLRADQLLVIDQSRSAVTDRIALPGGAHELLDLPDGRIVVSIEQLGLLAVVDLESGGVEVIRTGGLPHGLALDGGLLLVTDRDAGQLRRFELDGWRELPPLEAGRWPHAVTVTPDGTIVVASALDGALRIDDRVIAVSELPETVSVARDGALATAGAVGGDLHVFDAAGDEELRVALGGRPVRVLFSPDGATIAVALSASGEVALVDRAAGDGELRVRRIDVQGVPDGLAFSAGGDRLYASDVLGGGVAILDPVAGTLIGAIEGGTATGALLTR